MDLKVIKAMMAYYLIMEDYGNFYIYLKKLEKALKNGNNNDAD